MPLLLELKENNNAAVALKRKNSQDYGWTNYTGPSCMHEEKRRSSYRGAASIKEARNAARRRYGYLAFEFYAKYSVVKLGGSAKNINSNQIR